MELQSIAGKATAHVGCLGGHGVKSDVRSSEGSGQGTDGAVGVCEGRNVAWRDEVVQDPEEALERPFSGRQHIPGTPIDASEVVVMVDHQ